MRKEKILQILQIVRTMLLFTILIFLIALVAQSSMEAKVMDNEKLELRTIDFNLDSYAENENTLSGLAVAYNSASSPMYDFLKRQKYREIILPTAIDFDNKDIRCLFAHDTKYILGRTKNNTLKLEHRDDGLYFSVDIPSTTWAVDLSKSVKRGDIDKMSFGFYPLQSRLLDDDLTIAKHGMPIKEISKLHLVEISIVSSPAYNKTNVRELENVNNDSLKNINQYENRKRQIQILKTRNI